MKESDDRRETQQQGDSPLERVTGEPDVPPEQELADTEQRPPSPDKSRPEDDTKT